MSKINPIRAFRAELEKQRGRWRLADGTYNTYGQPVFEWAEYVRLRAESETEKVLVRADGLEFVWAWTKWNPPTRTYWGLSPAGFVYLVRDGTAEIFRCTTLPALDAWWRERTGRPARAPRERPKTRDVRFFTDERSRLPFSNDNSRPREDVFEELYLPLLSAGEYYAGRQACERRAARRLEAGEHVSWVYEEFVDWVKTFAARQDGNWLAIDCRWVAYNFALQLEAEWRIRPQDYREVA